jgi:hypothetical protein
MGVVIRLAPERTGTGDTLRYSVVLASGDVIGSVEPLGPGRFAARVPWGHSLAGWLAQGDTESFENLSDAAAAVWLSWLASPPISGPTASKFSSR